MIMFGYFSLATELNEKMLSQSVILSFIDENTTYLLT